jgi:acylphosphatase
MVDKSLIKVYGEVQGVGLRYTISTFSKENELTGYAQNLSDGSVEVFAEGPKSSILKLIDFIKSSPGVSRVSNVEVEWKDPANREFSYFKIKF